MADSKAPKAKDSGVKKCRALMYVQQTRYLTQFKDKADIINHLKTAFPDAQWAYILHNRDVDNAGAPLADHVHIAFYFDNPRSPSAVAQLMHDKPQSVEMFKGRWGKANMFAYLLHITAQAAGSTGKSGYDLSDVTANFDYTGYIDNVKQTAEAKKLDIDEVKARIVSGDIILKDFFVDGKLGNATTAGLFYSDNKAKIDRAIETRYRIQMSHTEGAIDLEVIYIQGSSGSGKTTIAKEYAKRRYGDYFMSGSSNDAVQDYMGEPVAIFDDARPSDYTASDWLKILDPYNNKSTVTSRYYNKYLAVKCIILTTTTAFREFFLYAKNKGGVDEPVSQFMRRFSVVIDVTKETDDLGRPWAVGQLYRVARLPKVQSLPVGKYQQMVAYEHTLIQENGKIIRVQIPEKNAEKTIDEMMRYFS